MSSVVRPFRKRSNPFDLLLTPGSDRLKGHSFVILVYDFIDYVIKERKKSIVKKKEEVCVPWRVVASAPLEVVCSRYHGNPHSRHHLVPVVVLASCYCGSLKSSCSYDFRMLLP